MFLRLIIYVLIYTSGIVVTHAQQAIKVVSSASIFKDMVDNIGGDLVVSKTIVPTGSDPHLYEPTPSDASMVQQADLILINGLTFEGWIQKLVKNSGSKAPMITITEGVDAIQSQAYANAADPHAWMDASNGLIYAKNIRDALIKADPVNAETYRKRHDDYAAKLIQLDTEIQQKISLIPQDKRILITSHDAFAYYGRRYGLQLQAIQGISTESEAQTSDVVRVSAVIADSKVPAVFIESTINPKLIKQIAKDNGVAIGGELYADSLGEPGSPGDTYIGMLKHNTQTIVDALTGNLAVSSSEESSDSKFPWMLLFGIAIILGASLLFAIKRFR